MSLKYPPADRETCSDQYFGAEVADPYRWLEDGQSSATKKWSIDQEQLWQDQIKQLSGRDHWAQRLTTLLGAGYISTPAWRGARSFYMCRKAGEELGILYSRKTPDSPEVVLLDPIAIDSTGKTTLDAFQPSKEGNLLAYQLSAGGTEESSIYVLDIESKKIIDGPIDRGRYSPIAWLPGENAFYYVRRLAPDLIPAEEEQFHRRVYLHKVGTPAENDIEIWGAEEEITSYYGVTVSMDGRWLSISASAGTEPRNDLWLSDLQSSSIEKPDLILIQSAESDSQTDVQALRDGRILIGTDFDAPRGRICISSPSTLLSMGESAQWRELVAEDQEAVMGGWAILDGDQLPGAMLLVSWERHGVSEISIHSLETGERQSTIPLPGSGTLIGLSERPEGGHEAWIGYTDHVTPPTVYHFDARTLKLTKYADPPGSVAVPKVFSKQITYKSLDETLVRMFVLSPTQKPDQPRPTVLYGYGGFGVGLSPGYSASALAWVEAGGVWVVANIRGGDEEGEDWHRDGMRGEKQNVFDDFHSAARTLIEQGWTTSAQLSIEGGSNGGLLVGAALTQEPALYSAVVCSAPLLDMVRYEKHGLGATWSDEYGSAEIEEEFEWLISYSPYHQVREGINYPATLFTVFDSDTRVDPLHARKMCAALQHATVGDSPVLIRAEFDVGHGARSLTRSIDLTADTLAFHSRWSGMSPTGGAK
ncbi:MAG: S9 family peptidase [Candidatus Nanopelagicaceae bacterium]|nr:S9 family peptidase [Candidatus Nanopelagicaceae bacterium]